MRLNGSELGHFPFTRDGLGLVPVTSLCHLTDSIQRLYSQGTSQSLPPLLQCRRLVSGHAVSGLGPHAGQGPGALAASSNWPFRSVVVHGNEGIVDEARQPEPMFVQTVQYLALGLAEVGVGQLHIEG